MVESWTVNQSSVVRILNRVCLYSSQCLHLCVSVYTSVSKTECVCLYVSVYISVSTSLCLHLCVYISVSTSMCVCLHLSVCIFVCLSTFRSVCLFFFFTSLSTSVYLSTSHGARGYIAEFVCLHLVVSLSTPLRIYIILL